MRREGHLMERIASRENLRQAYALARKAQSGRRGAAPSVAELETWLEALGAEIRAGTVEVGQFHSFVIHDPKRRVIHAAAFRERVLHQAMMLVAGPVLERRSIADSYACRPGKGVHRARARALAFAGEFAFHLKLDIRRYFDSIHHEVALAQMRHCFKDAAFLQLLERVVRSYECSSGRGLPIGSLVSQHLANAYLGPLDRFIKENLSIRGYVRYMDDFVLFSNSADELAKCRDEVERVAREHLRLTLKERGQVVPTRSGLPFLGARITPWAIYPSRRTRRRLVRKVADYERAHVDGRLTELGLQRRVLALVAVVASMRCRAWRRRVFANVEAVS